MDYLDPFQLGFRTGHGMEMALVRLFNDFWDGWNMDTVSIIPLLDLSVTFDTELIHKDTIDHDILLD